MRADISNLTPNTMIDMALEMATDPTAIARELTAQMQRMIASGGKIDAKEQQALNASMKDVGFTPAQRARLLSTIRDANQDGGGISRNERNILSDLTKGYATENALSAHKGGGHATDVATDPAVMRASRKLEAVTAQAGKDGMITPAETKQILAAKRDFLDAVKAAGRGGAMGGSKGIDTGPMADKITADINRRMADGEFSGSDKMAVNKALADAGFDKQSRASAMDSIQKMMLDGLTETMKKRHGGEGGGDDGKGASSSGGGGGGGGGVSIGEIARVLGEALNEQFKKLVDAANALGSNPSAQQTAQLQALSAQVNANAGALTNAQRSAEEALKAVARA